MSDQGPTVFKDRYEVHRKLARGGMSDVYLARDRVLDRPVALKVLFPEYAKDATFVARFRREAQAAARLNHPNIVGVYDWGEETGTYFIAMEYIEGRTLGEIVRADGPLHPRRAAEAAADVAGALGFAHRNGVIHRDVKPGNVMCEKSGLIKVADFGIAQAMGGPEQTQLTRAGSVMGTATYFSPEQAQGRQVDPRSDIYSLGCVLFEILTGRPPFSGETPVAIAYKHVQEAPPRPSSLAQVPPPLEAIVLKCLAKTPDGRYATAEDLRADLRRFLEGHPVAALATAGAAAGLGATAATAAYGGPPTAAGLGADATTAMPATGGYPPAGTGMHQPYGTSPPEKQKPNPWLIGALVVFLLLMAGGLIYLASSMSSSGGGKAVVPSVIGRPYDDILNDPQVKKFKVVKVDAANETVAPGVIFDQDPKANQSVDEGSTLTVSVSTGPAGFEVPNVIGKMRDDAVRELSNFQVVENPVPHDTEPVGKVIDQNPKSGRLPGQTRVTITVSQGKSAIAVPDVAGLSISSARDTLQLNGFTQTPAVKAEASDMPRDRVIRTEPPAGSQADKNTRITLVVSSGPAPTSTTTSTTTSTSTTRTTRGPTTTD